MSLLARPMLAAKMAVKPPMIATTVSACGHGLEERVGAGDQVHASGDHRGGVDQGRNRCRAFHRVGQPHVQRELAALTDRAREQAQAGPEQAPAGRAGSGRSRAPVLCSTCSNSSDSWSVPPAFHRMIRPIRKPTSPTRVVRNAFLAAIHGGSRCTPRMARCGRTRSRSAGSCTGRPAPSR